jgi:hypothetical protein
MMERRGVIDDIGSTRVEVGNQDGAPREERETMMLRWLRYRFTFLGYTILGYIVCIVMFS